MKYIKIFTLISILIFIACAKDIVDTTGTIEGIVKDNTTSTPLQGCAVTLSPTGKSVTTGQDGHYAFEALDANNYSIEFSKVGYEANKKEVTVVAGRSMQVDVMLKKISNALIVNPDVLNFGDLETSKSLFVSAIEQLGSIRYTIKTDADWISFSATEGNATSVGNKITVVIDRSNLSLGNYEKNITISSTYGDVIIPVIVNQVERGIATLTTGLPENVTETSLTIKGTIIKTGGSKIISYGHCWAENENPTIDNNKTNLGDTEAVGDFTSTLTQLVPGKTYYIRAYAINSTGAAYSEQATVKIPFIEKPTVTTLAISGLCKDSVVLNGEITNDGDGNIKEHGFYWGYTENTEYKQSVKLPSDAQETKFAYTKKNLLSDTTYYYKAYAVNEKGESCGEIKKFKSLDKNFIEGVPVVETNEATNITTSSATLNGIIVNSGDTKVIQRGFYYGTSENSMTKKIIESTDSIMVLNLTGLKDATKYYFKAFAINQKGEAYGNVQTFTTLDESIVLPWDGNIASSFAGGSGTKYDPYIIKDGGQLLYAFKQGGYYKLAKDINLNNKNWRPFNFSGTLDGNGYSIYNLLIDRNDESYYGLVGSLTGTIKNLTITGVNIKTLNSYIGTIAGYLNKNGTIENCKVKLTVGSILQGYNHIGGIVGMIPEGAKIENCIVEANNDGIAIVGFNNVGGVAGGCDDSYINNCRTYCNIIGENCVGGILGSVIYDPKGYYTTINKCEYAGNLNGISKIGGIVGYSSNGVSITSCKVTSNMEASKWVSGILGYADNKLYIKACYTNGNIKCSETPLYSGPFCGRTGGYGYIYFSYTTMQVNGKFGQINGTDCFSIHTSNNITQSMIEAYSEYAEYWNFNKTWTWSGTVNGVSKSITCPRLSWE